MSDTHEPSDKPEAERDLRASHARSDRAAQRKSARSAAPRTDKPNAKLLSITLDADTAQVVRVERLDATGNRQELSDNDKATLTARERNGGLESLVEEAFEAGIACVLDGDTELDKTPESPEDAKIRHQLLAPLIERSAVRHLLESAVLNRAALRTLIDQPMQSL